MMKYGFYAGLLLVMFLSTGCSIPFMGTFSKPPVLETLKRTPMEKIMISEMDILDRPYTLISEVNASIEQRLPFGSDTLKERVTKTLQEKAATLDADAVIFVRYTPLEKTWTRWGGMEVKGKAIKFSYY